MASVGASSSCTQSPAVDYMYYLRRLISNDQIGSVALHQDRRRDPRHARMPAFKALVDKFLTANTRPIGRPHEVPDQRDGAVNAWPITSAAALTAANRAGAVADYAMRRRPALFLFESCDKMNALDLRDDAPARVRQDFSNSRF
jgi:hypothetical protein